MIDLKALAEDLRRGTVDTSLILDVIARALAAEKGLDQALKAGLEMTAEVKDLEQRFEDLKKGVDEALLETFTKGRFIGREESAVAVSMMPEWSSDLGCDALERGHVVHTIRTFVGARDYVAVKKTDLALMKKAFEGVKPPKSCPFCEEYPCSSCMERARIVGELSTTMKGLDGILAEAS